MKRFLVAAVAALTMLALAAVAAAALSPGVYDPGNTGCPKATYAKGTLHLEKNCATTVNAAAGADITGAEGQTFTSASFTLANATQCQGGSPRFVIVTSTGLFPLGCNNVAPVAGKKGAATYLFTAATLAAAGQQVPTPTGTIQAVSVLIDVEGKADLTKITFNGKPQRVTSGHGKNLAQAACTKGAWKTFTSPKFKNQGQCVKFVVHARNSAKRTARG
jgi:hypothetical protein